MRFIQFHFPFPVYLCKRTTTSYLFVFCQSVNRHQSISDCSISIRRWLPSSRRRSYIKCNISEQDWCIDHLFWKSITMCLHKVERHVNSSSHSLKFPLVCARGFLCFFTSLSVTRDLLFFFDEMQSGCWQSGWVLCYAIKSVIRQSICRRINLNFISFFLLIIEVKLAC